MTEHNRTMRHVPTALAFSAALAATTLGSPDAHGQTLSAVYNASHGTTMLRAENATDNTYGFIDLIGDGRFDTETVYGEFRANQPIGKGFKIGLDFSGGSGVQDRARAQAVYGAHGRWGWLETRLAHSITDDAGVRLGIAGGTSLHGVDLGMWSSVDLKGGPHVLGEIEASKRVYGNVSAVARLERYPWSGPALQFGGKVAFR